MTVKHAVHPMEQNFADWEIEQRKKRLSEIPVKQPAESKGSQNLADHVPAKSRAAYLEIYADSQEWE